MANIHEPRLHIRQAGALTSVQRLTNLAGVGWLAILWLLGAVVAGFFCYYSLHQQVNERAELYQRGARIALEETDTRLQQISSIIAEDPKVRVLVAQARAAVALEGGGAGGPEAARIRMQLSTELQSYWAILNQGDGRQLQVHLPDDVTSFLRMHVPKHYGDSLVGIRPLVAQVLKTGKPEHGFEVGRIYSGQRAIAPIFAPNDNGQSKPVGSVELGSGLKGVLERLEDMYGVKAGILLPGTTVRTHVWPDEQKKRHFGRLMASDYYLDGLQEPDFKTLLDHVKKPSDLVQKAAVLRTGGGHWLAAAVSLDDQRGTKAPGLLVGVENIEDLYATFQREVLEVVLAALAGFALSAALFFWRLRRDSGLWAKRLRSSEQSRQTLFDLSPSPIKESDAAGRIIQFNGAYGRKAGLPASAIIGRSAALLESEVMGQQELDDFWQTLRSGQVWRGTFFNHLVSGTGFWDSVEVVPILDDSGGLERVLWFHHDVSHEYGELERARDNYHFLDEILAESPAVIYQIDIQYPDRVVYVSPNIRSLFGHEPEQLLRHAGWWGDHLHPDDRERAFEEGRWTEWTSGQKDSRYRLRHGDGHYGWVTDRARVLYDGNGEPIALVGALADADEQIQLQRRLAESERLYRLIFESVREAIFLIRVEPDGGFRFVSSNPEHARTTGLSAEFLAGKQPRDILPPETADWVEGHYRECVQRRETIRYSEQLNLPGGERYWHTSLTPVINDEGVIELIVGLAVDQTEDQRIRSELEHYATRLAQAQEIAQLGYVECTLDQPTCNQSELLDRWFGPTDSTETGHDDDLPEGVPPAISHLFHAVSRQDQGQLVKQVRAQRDYVGGEVRCEVSMRRLDGEERTIVWDLTVRAGSDGKPNSLIGTLQDITERVAAEQIVRSIHRRNAVILKTVGDGIFGVDCDRRITFTNPAARQLLGFTEEVRGQRAVDILYGGSSPEDGLLSLLAGHEAHHGVQDMFQARDGRRFPVRYSITPIPDDYNPARGAGAVIAFSDITEIKQNEQRLRELATTDELTGLPNRRYFMSRLEEEYQRGRRYGTEACVLMMDIDHFKRVNDRYGHAAGDEVLRAFADVCRSIMRQTDLCGRLGGEEFAVLLPSTGKVGALGIAERLREAVEGREIVFDGEPIRVTCSLGVCDLFGVEVSASGDALICADLALYQAKSQGRNQVCWNDRSDHRTDA